ncbi:MAG: hypothetical protein QOH81_1964 [Sphingomonadales bacterium]|jgi:hypothetical protein|nr:hypothetical protein [Sphingomonadales bacterium]
MLVGIIVTVKNVGEAQELVDLGRPHRVGGVIGALLEELERAHPGVPLLEHVITIRSEPAKGEPTGPVLIR